MNRPTGRVLTLLELLQTGGLRTAAELAERLGVDERTVRRYVEHLLDLDIPVESVRGRYGGYRLSRGFRLPPLMLSDDEALAVLLGLVVGRRAGLTAALGPAGETASAKIRRVLPERLASRLQAVQASIAFTDSLACTDSPDRPSAVDATILLTVSDAVAHHRPLAVTHTGRDGVRTDRTLHPYGIVNHRDRWYVTGWDPVAGAERTFRLDRITAARTLPGSFDPPAGFDAARSVLTAFATADYRHRVSLRIQGTVERIRTRLPASIATIDPPTGEQEKEEKEKEEDAAATWHHVEIRAERLDWLPPALAALDLPFEIERPEELRDQVTAFAERLAARARARSGAPGRYPGAPE